MNVMALSVNANNQLFAGTHGGGIFRSVDNGDSWTQINSGLTCTDVRAITFTADNYIFAGTGVGGVYRSLDNGDSWTQVNAGLTNININSIIADKNDFLFAGSDGRGIFKTIEPITGIKETVNPQNRPFSLDQNYPNPFSQSTTINFELLNQCDVNLFIFDAFGQKVSTLIDENLKPGNYSVVWDGCGADETELSTGLYFYRFESNDNVETRQMVFLK
jgi:hypothetical protein